MIRVLTGYASTFNRLIAFGYDFQTAVRRVSELFNMTAGEILEPSKKPERLRARSLVCFWAVTELGVPGTVVGKRRGIVQAVSKGPPWRQSNHIRIEDSRNR